MNSLKAKYQQEVVGQLMKEFGYKSVMAVPKIKSISLGVGLSRAASNPNFTTEVIEDLKKISGQSPAKNKARKAISGFKIRQGQDVGLTVSLRGKRMWDFALRLVASALPRVRDFQGISENSFDQKGNLSFGVKEQLIFPEISSDEVNTIFSLQVNISTTAKTKEEGISLLKKLGFPIRQDKKSE